MKQALQFPRFSIFFLGFYMLPWFFAIALPLLLISILLSEFTHPALPVLNMIMGFVGLALIAPWFFRWCIICAGLMYGRPRLAEQKLDYLEQKLESRS
ncbi:hypothetical protein [Cognatiyoonia sp. IB215182]|uniref:hypothetical protein n=1 Tax=Cognatiyoonia sp. IB215182 TaxID=3097353 RepID=UPI002A15860D|nr:hypothetical protein [Cognatiyoonia sp. IB215182]MDX8353363.1 hypothetical protein [Cognatiyoonia sp. IB215182]